MNVQDVTINSEIFKPYIYTGLTLLIAVIIDHVLRSLIIIPKFFSNRKTNNAIVIIKNFVSLIVYLIAAYTILRILGVDLAPLLASASIIGIVLGIGARSTIEDFVTGLFFLSLDSIAVGDYVKIGETEGYVDTIGSRTVTIKAGDGSLHIFPNSQVKGVANFSRNKATTVITLPIKTNQEIEKVLATAEQALIALKKAHVSEKKVLPESKVNGISEFLQPEIMNVQVAIITPPAARWEIAREYRLLVKKAFEKEKITFA